MNRTISKTVARRYLLGRQGLWPGRRWAGKEGAARAIRQVGCVQMDPLTAVARSHDLMLWSRVAGYEPQHLESLLYEDREFFDYGGILFVYPMEELPYWRLHMRRRREQARYADFFAQHGPLVESVLAELRARGPLGNRDFDGNARVESYRARKDTGLALYNLWITGELMTHSRRSFQRAYYFRDEVAPPHARHEAGEEEAERYFARKAISDLGLHTASAWASSFSHMICRRPGKAELKEILEGMIAAGEAREVRIEGQRVHYYLPAEDLPILDVLEDGGVPEEWRALDTTTREEVNLLAPLDNLLARQRTRDIFDFEYVWEVYKPAELRRWGYYTLPILYEDRLVGRLDPKLDRKAGTLAIKGFWLEDPALGEDPEFASALAQGLAGFVRFHGARRADLSALEAGALPSQVERKLSDTLAAAPA